MEVLEAMVSEWRPGRVGLKLSPAVGLGDLQPTEATLPTYERLVSQVAKLKIAYLQLQDSPTDLTGTPVEALDQETARHFRKFFNGPIIANGGLDKATAEAVIASGAADAAAFGSPYLANPYLVERLQRGVPLAPVPPREAWYGGGAAGYVDFARAT